MASSPNTCLFSWSFFICFFWSLNLVRLSSAFNFHCKFSLTVQNRFYCTAAPALEGHRLGGPPALHDHISQTNLPCIPTILHYAWLSTCLLGPISAVNLACLSRQIRLFFNSDALAFCFRLLANLFTPWGRGSFNLGDDLNMNWDLGELFGLGGGANHDWWKG